MLGVNVEWVKEDRRISLKRKGNVLSSCVTRVYMNTLETMALTEKQHKKVQVCEKQPGMGNLIRENG